MPKVLTPGPERIGQTAHFGTGGNLLRRAERGSGPAERSEAGRILQRPPQSLTLVPLSVTPSRDSPSFLGFLHPSNVPGVVTPVRYSGVP